MNLSVGHRPKFKVIPDMPQHTIVTLLLVKEGGSEVCSAVRAAGKHSVHVPFKVRDEQVEHVRHAADKVAQLLRDGDSVFVHCSAGLHRTGTFTYAVLRRLDFSHDEAVAEIARIRPETAEAMIPFVEWAIDKLLD